MLTALLGVALLAVPQLPIPLPPGTPAAVPAVVGNVGGLLRYVDFHEHLDDPGLVVVVGTLDKWKAGKRERLEHGEPAGGLVRVSLGNTLYFKVPVKASVSALRATFAGAPKSKLDFECDLQLARLGDGSEQFQTMTPGRTPVQPGLLAMFVLAPRPGAKKPMLLHVVPFDPQLDTGPSPENRFVDTMHDYVAINRRVHDLERAIDAVQRAAPGAPQQQARQALTDLLAAPVELHQQEQRTLLSTQTAPFELRARELLAAPAAATPAPGQQPGK